MPEMEIRKIKYHVACLNLKLQPQLLSSIYVVSAVCNSVHDLFLNSYWKRLRPERGNERRRRPGRWKGKKQLSRICWSRPHRRWNQRLRGREYVSEQIKLVVSQHPPPFISDCAKCFCDGWRLTISGQREIPKRTRLWRRDAGVGEEKNIQRFHACLRGEAVVTVGWSVYKSWWWCLTLLLFLFIYYSMNASITTQRQRSTQRSQRSTTGNDPALDQSVLL